MIETDQEFTMPYPCFLVGSESGSFTTIDVDGEQCLCLFTDEDLANSYGEEVGSAVVLTPFQTPDELLHSLEILEPQLREDGILHVAIDSAPGKRTPFVLTTELIAELRAGQI